MSGPCRQSALRFLKIRPRSIGELKEKLRNKGFQAEEINQTIDWLINIKLLDDRSFTKSWIQYRLARPFGFKRIILELKAKGIEPQIIEEEIALVKNESDENQSALALARRRWPKWAALDLQKKKKRLFDFLIRRGFSPEIIFKVMKELT